MKLVKLNEGISQDVDEFINLKENKDKFRTITNFVNEAVAEKIASEKIKLYTPEFISDLFKKHEELKEIIQYALGKTKQNTSLIINIADFLIGASKITAYEGSSEKIANALKKDNKNDAIIDMCLLLDVPIEQKNSVVNFLNQIDNCLKSHPKKRLNEIETDSKEFYGRLLVKYKEEKDGKT